MPAWNRRRSAASWKRRSNLSRRSFFLLRRLFRNIPPELPENPPSLLLLIPAYNEEQRIGPTLERYGSFLRDHYPGKVSIVVVLNGCRDNTLGVVKEAESRHPTISHMVFPGAIGKGGALIEGLKLWPLANLVGYVDADGATPPAAFLDLVTRCAAGEADVVIASRWMAGAKITHAQAGKRRFASRLFHLFVEGFFWMGIRDTQCGAKVIRREAIEKVHAYLRLADLAFDVNLLYSIRRAGFTVKEVPTEWNDQTGSKVSFNVRTSANMVLSLARLRLLYSPFHGVLRPLAPLEAWLYRKLNAPPPRRGEID